MKQILLALSLLSLVACTTAFQRPDGTYDVPRNVEVRSPFGTNAGFVKLEHCTTKETTLLIFDSYSNCHRHKDWTPTQSQGQGGQVASGAMIGLGFGLGSAFAGGGSSASATSSSISSARGHGH